MSESPVGPIKAGSWVPPESQLQEVFGGARELAFLTSYQVMLMLLVWGLHFENRSCRAMVLNLGCILELPRMLKHPVLSCTLWK